MMMKDMREKIHLFFWRIWKGLMVFKPLLVRGLILWSYNWTCASMRWSQESPRSKKMFLIFVQALIYHHRRHHHLRFLLFLILLVLCFLAVYLAILWHLNNLVFLYLHGMIEQLWIMLYDYVVFIYIWSIHVSCFMIGLYFSMIVVWMISCICMFHTCYALWLFVDAKGGEK